MSRFGLLIMIMISAKAGDIVQLQSFIVGNLQIWADQCQDRSLAGCITVMNRLPHAFMELRTLVSTSPYFPLFFDGRDGYERLRTITEGSHIAI